MQTLPILRHSRTIPDLENQIREVHRSLADFYRSVPLDLFTSDGVPEGWSAKRNLMHVTKTNFLIVIWSKLPKWVLRIWPKPNNTDSLERLQATNRPGISEYGSYLKSEPFSEQEREKLIEKMLLSSEKVVQSLSKRTEEDMDKFTAFISGASIRMFYHFLLKHNIHHTNVVRIRLKATLKV